MSDQPTLRILSTNRVQPFTYRDPTYPVGAHLYLDDLNNVCFTVAFPGIRIDRYDFDVALEIEWALIDRHWHAFIDDDLDPIFSHPDTALPSSDVLRAAAEAAIECYRKLGYAIVDKRPASLLDVREHKEPSP